MHEIPVTVPAGRRQVDSGYPARIRLRCGSDQPGLICGYPFPPGQPGAAPRPANVQQWLRDPAAPGFVWLHVNLADASARRCIEAELPVVEELFEALRQGSGSTRIGDADDSVVAEGSTSMADNDGESDEARVLWPLQATAWTYRIAFGPRAGQKVLTVQGAMSRDGSGWQCGCPARVCT